MRDMRMIKRITQDPINPKVTILWACDDECMEVHLAAARSTGLTVGEVAKLARAIVRIESDPLPSEELGEPFDFDDFRMPRSVPLELGDLYSINPLVPPPNARVDLDRARQEFRRDNRSVGMLLEHHWAELSLEMRLSLHRNCVDWLRFWSVRDPDPAVRAWLADEVARGEADEALIVAWIALKRGRRQ